MQRHQSRQTSQLIPDLLTFNKMNYLENTVRLIHDGDKKFKGINFAGLRMRAVALPPRSPYLNAYAERFVLTAKTECLNHSIILNEHHLIRVLREFQEYYNFMRPHQGINQNIPLGDPTIHSGTVTKIPTLGGLHYHY